MEVITKLIHSTQFRISIPLIYLKLLGLQSGDTIKITPNLNGYYLIEKGKDRKGMTISTNNDFFFPAHLMHKYRITNKHTFQFIINNGRLILSFNKPKNE